MYVVISVHTKVGAYCGQGREEKKCSKESEPWVVGSDCKCLGGCHVPRPVFS